MKNRIKGMMLGIIIGDALGTPVHGMSKGHISSVFNRIESFVDPLAALQGKKERWRKPGLYSSISQMMILISAYTISHKKEFWKNLLEIIKNDHGAKHNEYGIFRHPGPMERDIIEKIKTENSTSNQKIFSYPNSSIAIILSSFALKKLNSTRDLILSALRFSSMMNQDIHSITGALIYIDVLKSILNSNEAFDHYALFSLFKNTPLSIYEEIEQKISADIFEIGFNPETVLSSIELYSSIFHNIEYAKDKDDAENRICLYLNGFLKNNITRATVDHPLSIIPFAFFLVANCLEKPSEILFTAVNEGGSTSILCALSGALTGAIFGTEWIPENLIESLVNKKRILGIVDSISSGKISDVQIQDFVESEASLTIKELDEKTAKLKHIKPKDKIKKQRKDKEKELSKHVVESWTKADKAKWRKKLDNLDTKM